MARPVPLGLELSGPEPSGPKPLGPILPGPKAILDGSQLSI